MQRPPIAFSRCSAVKGMISGITFVETDEATGNTTCTLNDGNGTECALTYNVDGQVTEQGCEGPWGATIALRMKTRLRATS